MKVQLLTIERMALKIYLSAYFAWLHEKFTWNKNVQREYDENNQHLSHMYWCKMQMYHTCIDNKN